MSTQDDGSAQPGPYQTAPTQPVEPNKSDRGGHVDAVITSITVRR
jgi:hypothetical protein